MTRTSTYVLIFALAFSGAATAGAERVEIHDDLWVEKLEDGLWLHVSYDEVPDFGRAAANGLVVVAGRKAALVDTPWTDAQTERLIAWVDARLGATVTTVVITHSHNDCMGGLAAAHRLGVESYAFDKTIELARAAGNEVPRHGFDGEHELRLGRRRLVLRHVGAGHTVDNSVVWIPDAETLYGGCLVRSATSKTLGYTDEGDLAAWPATIQRLLEDYGEARRIVPGHGTPGGREHLERTLELLATAE